MHHKHENIDMTTPDDLSTKLAAAHINCVRLEELLEIRQGDAVCGFVDRMFEGVSLNATCPSNCPLPLAVRGHNWGSNAVSRDNEMCLLYAVLNLSEVPLLLPAGGMCQACRTIRTN